MDDMIEQGINPEMGTGQTRVTSNRESSHQPTVKRRMGWFAFFVALLKEAIRVRVAPAASGGPIQGKSGFVDRTGESPVLVPRLVGTNLRSR
jgi:hypothetical protein